MKKGFSSTSRFAALRLRTARPLWSAFVFALVIITLTFTATGCQPKGPTLAEGAEAEGISPVPQETAVADAVSAPEATDAPVLWGQQIGTPEEDLGLTIAVDAQGNSCAAGFTSGDVSGTNLGGKDVLISKFDAEGKILWTLQTGTPEIDQASSVIFDKNGDLYVCGNTYGTFEGASGTGQIFLQKISGEGQVLWTKQYGGVDSASGNFITLDEEGNLLLAGATSGDLSQASAGAFSGKAMGMNDAFVIKLSAEGEVLWTSQWGTPEGDSATGISLTSNGLIHVIGNTYGTLGKESLGDSDYFYTQLSADGKVGVSYQYGTEYRDNAAKLAVDAAGNLFLSGTTDGALVPPAQGNGDAALIKAGPDGVVLWQRQFGTSLWDGIHDILIDPADPTSVIVGGCGNYDQCEAFIIKYDANGNVVWNKTQRPEFSTCGREIALDAQGNLYQTGGTHGSLYGGKVFEGFASDLFIYKIPAN